MSLMPISDDISRRRFLAGAGGTAAVVALAQAGLAGLGRPAVASAQSSGDAFDALRVVWTDIVTGGAFDPADSLFADAVGRLDNAITGLVGQISREPGRTRVFTNLPLAAGEVDARANNLEGTCRQLVPLARGLVTPGSRWLGNPDLLADVLEGLATTNEVIYHTEQRGFGNWWNWQIGASKPFLHTCALVYEHLEPETLQRYLAAIDHFVPNPRTIQYLDFTNPNPHPATRAVATSSGRVSLSEVRMYRGILGRTAEDLDDARQALVEPESRVFNATEEEGGFYEDGSYIAHGNVAYTGGYGVDLLTNVSKVFGLLGGSPWSLAGTEGQVVLDAVERSYAPVIFNGALMSAVRGRNLSRGWDHEHRAAHRTILGILDLAHTADEETARRWRGICRGWVERDNWDSLVGNPSVPQVARLKEMLDDSVQPILEPTGLRLFPGMARAVHRGDGWAVAISMASKRVAYYEAGNGENLRGFHTGDGMTNLYNDDTGQYTDNFWATVDPYRLAGITVDTKRLPQAAGGTWGEAHPEHATWAGGASSADGSFGAVGMELEALLSPLRAKKSWFCLPESIVALGAGITGSNEGERVETVIEHRSLHTNGTHALVVDGAAQPVEQGWQETLNRVRWAHLEGAGGYLFPSRTTLHALREERTGRWRDINTNEPNDERTRRFLTLWLDHGADPQDASYAYVLAPGATPERTATLARDPGFQILANTNEVQAIRVPPLGLTAANFFAAGSVGDLTVAEPCSVLVQKKGRELRVAVSDPTQEQDSITVTLHRPGHRSFTGDNTIHVNGHRPHEISFTVDVRGALGATRYITFRL